MARTELLAAVASILIVAGVLAIPLAAPTQTTDAPAAVPRPLGTPTATATPSAANLVGSGCAAYQKKVPTGQGSVVGMSQEPVAIAAANNPMLTTLTSALWGKLNPTVNLVSTLDSGQYTVFAPVDSAFAKLPAATIASLKLPANAKQLSSILEFHVVKGELLPANVDGLLPTLQGGMLTVKGSGAGITVNGASVICGGIQTANATVYLIDTVLTPPAN
ncbi:MAG TPA: fasciclin domain-containing protein [Galbitalea sp.]|nr:fasciclin domain-containing protein [Galbitalea sp.]